MSDFKAEPLFKQIEEGLAGMSDKEKKDIQKKVSFYDHNELMEAG